MDRIDILGIQRRMAILSAVITVMKKSDLKKKEAKEK